jgi:hypothetical protein
VRRKDEDVRVGDWVEVRSKEEILETLDKSGQLEGMPFMPEMFAFCGKRFQVFKRAHKTCDTVFPIRGRRVERAVHLETRCDGQAHGGCQAACLLFWKEAWLRPVGGDSARSATVRAGLPSGIVASGIPGVATESDVWSSARVDDTSGGEPTYVCQATRLPFFTAELSWWDIRQYIEDYRSGNVGLHRILGGLLYSIFFNLSQAGVGLGRPMRWLYNKCYPIWRGTLFPRTSGAIPEGQATPTISLNLQPGELARVKPHVEILRTITTTSKNRGMSWDAEMVPYCGGVYRVLKRVSHIIDEKTGKMRQMKNPCVILDSAICQARYSSCRMFCPRSIYPYWREIWLERVDSGSSPNGKRDER